MMAVNVTQKHIDHGINRGGRCPIALAIREELVKNCAELNWRVLVIPGAVGISCSRGTSPMMAHTYPLPAEANIFIRLFDVGSQVEPFFFAIESERDEPDPRELPEALEHDKGDTRFEAAGEESRQ